MALGIKLLLHNQQMVSIVLGVAIAGASIPLLISLVQQVLKGNFSVDILALLSIVTSIVLGQYWVAAIVVLMLSGGQALEAYATGAGFVGSECTGEEDAANRPSGWRTRFKCPDR